MDIKSIAQKIVVQAVQDYLIDGNSLNVKRERRDAKQFLFGKNSYSEIVFISAGLSRKDIQKKCRSKRREK